MKRELRKVVSVSRRSFADCRDDGVLERLVPGRSMGDIIIVRILGTGSVGGD